MKNRKSNGVTRREFVTAAGGVLLASSVKGSGRSIEVAAAEKLSRERSGPAASKRKLLIGVFDPAFPELSLDAMIEKISSYGLEAVEIGTGGYPGSKHCPLEELLADPTKARAWKKKFEDRNLRIGALSCHGNPVHPDAAIAARDAQTFRRTVLLAERLEIPVIVGFSGCPGATSGDKTPSWITYGWPPEHAEGLRWQWEQKLIPYWKEAAKFAREHGVRRLALEMHPNMSVYNPRTLLKLREAVGEEIGANNDLSHLFWQGCDPVAVIRLLAKHGAIYHAHMKDTVLYADNVAHYGVLNFAFENKDLDLASETFRAVGYGHSASLWKEIVRTYMEVGYEGFLSIENEDPILTGEVGVERATYVLKNVRSELLA